LLLGSNNNATTTTTSSSQQQPQYNSPSSSTVSTTTSPGNVVMSSGEQSSSTVNGMPGVRQSASVLTSSNPADALVFLKKAVFRFITADDDSERETLLPVISTLLKFSKEEMEILSRELTPKNNTIMDSQGLSKKLLGVFGL
jgi:hypothetical protein